MIYRNNILSLIIFLTFLCVIQKHAFNVTYFQEECRFYAVTAADTDSNGQYEIIAVGQLNEKNGKGYSAYVALLITGDNGFIKHSDHTFNISISGKKASTRIRAVEVFRSGIKEEWNLLVSGRAGDDKRGAGFLYHSVIQNGKIIKRGEKIFQQAGAEETHGYPLVVTDLNGDGRKEIIYGGFYIKNGIDWADVRVFELEEGNLQAYSTPFKDLSIPFRVNAMDSGDINGDGRVDLVIAGRTKTSDGREFSAVAWWSGGKISFHIFKEKNSSRLRTIKIADLDGDRKNEILTGGRIESEDLWLADLRLWKVKMEKLVIVDNFCWSLGYRMRLRALSCLKGLPGHIKAGGRSEYLTPEGEKKWKGFIWEFSIKNSRLKPVHSPQYFYYGDDTRIRNLFLEDTGKLIAAGFIKSRGKKEKGFIFLEHLRK